MLQPSRHPMDASLTHGNSTMTHLGPNAHLVGRPGSRAELMTPARLIDLDALERNIAKMADFCRFHGIAGTDAALALARRIADSKTLKFGGVHAYAGPLQRIEDCGERRRRAEQANAMVIELEEKLESAKRNRFRREIWS